MNKREALEHVADVIDASNLECDWSADDILRIYLPDGSDVFLILEVMDAP